VPFPYEEFDLSGVRTYPLASRQSKARVEDFARPYEKGSGVGAWIDRLPNILAGADFKAIVSRLQRAKREDGGIIWGFGAHVIKTGLSPVLVDLMRRGFVSALATNGAACGTLSASARSRTCSILRAPRHRSTSPARAEVAVADSALRLSRGACAS